MSRGGRVAVPEAAAVRAALARVRTVVVKVGSAVIAAREGRPDPLFFWGFAADLAEARERGHRLVVVSSGAIALGRARLGWDARRRTMAHQQAAAAVGQCDLVQRYAAACGELGMAVAQVLLTHEDLRDRSRYMNARATLGTLLDQGVVPVINENDTVAVDEIRFGDNDQLSAMVAPLVDAGLLVLLSTVAGLHERDPRRDPGAAVVGSLAPGDPDPSVDGTAGAAGRGGAASKLGAARSVARHGVPAVIADGRERGILARILAGEPLGTLVLPAAAASALPARKHWIAFTLKTRGRIRVDEGARRAIVEGGRSLLPSGVRGVEGRFERGDAVSVVDAEGREVARGLCAYSAGEVERIRGLRSSRIEATLGVRYADEVIHRDDLVVV
ncbi:MAG: glutamate 5-kinase [Planctomycetes bacterium]|nr:glutamate 5-kinase [Planctomycetota bacterium]